MAGCRFFDSGMHCVLFYVGRAASGRIKASAYGMIEVYKTLNGASTMYRSDCMSEQAGMDGYDEVDSFWLCNGKIMERVLDGC